MENPDIQVFKNEEQFPLSGKRSVLILAVVVFIVAAVIAGAYGRLAAPLRPETANGELAKLANNTDFLAHTQLATTGTVLPETTKYPNLIDERESFTISEEQGIVVDEYLLNITKDKVVAPNWELTTQDSIIDSVSRSGGTLLISVRKAPSTMACPISVVKVKNIEVSVPCTDIYVNRDAGASTIYSVIALNMQSGVLAGNISFLGGTNDTLVYLSQGGALVAQGSQTPDNVQGFYNFLIKEGPSFLPPEILTKIQKLETYELSSEAKLVELKSLMRVYEENLPSESKANFLQKYTALVSEYTAGTSLAGSQVVSLGSDLTITNTYKLPGLPIVGSVYASEGEYYLGTAEPTSSGFTAAALHQLGSQNRHSLEVFPEAVSYSGHWLVVSQSGALSVVDLDGLGLNPLTLGKDVILAAYSDYFVVIHEATGFTGLRIYTLDDGLKYQTSIRIDELWSSTLANLTRIASSEEHNLLFLPGLTGDYLVNTSADALSVTQTLNPHFPASSYFSQNYLYILGNKVYIMDLGTSEIKELDLVL